ncbi:unnamed protein product [Zymoseptoria tritici ST99CH_3D1]|uniref:Vesicle tethering protein Uso1/P115-like head domain-containing protein n=1 Tax=Zymoseptoria tritici (strain ST99CH_3D7) TaxID=1276538 RepID=A0A1X7RD94_ZYMT9|nr:unnamed protein product [Zymoseptoria tritici ST99CH_3D7]SMR43914.1 unnamed protein product [Zymoseptoria tritici ST99CH_3D1]
MLKTPPMQTATATIETLCGRLQSATLLEDRRAAILGLRSFAKEYPASVASGSLRELISILKRDGLGETSSTRGQDGESRRSQEGGGDVDTIRTVLETLLMLFNPEPNSPEAGDEIALFLADEFSMRQDNIVLLLNLLDPTSAYADYYSRLYSVQLLSAICAARPERLQECILSAPLGTSRLVGVLDDSRDAVRNAGLLLLVDLTSGANEELRKIVAFEDVFGKVFALIRLEGGLADAGITAQDCLSLLANLIKGSASNQTMFRESGCVSQVAQLLTQAFPGDDAEAVFLRQNREKASWGLLQLLRLFLVRGESNTPQNQIAFFKAGIAQILIDLGFAVLPLPIRKSALRVAAALIEGNAPLQEQFAALTIVTPSDAEHNAEQVEKAAQTNGTHLRPGTGKGSARASVETRRTYIIEALLDLSLSKPQADPSLRAAACGLIQAYLTKHARIKIHFLQRAIAGHAEHEVAANVLTALLHPAADDTNGVVFASWIVQDLVADNIEAKSLLTAVKEGDESEGEDVVSATQALGLQLQATLQSNPVEERLGAAYASLLTTLLWDFAPGIDDLLAEGSSLLQVLVALVKTPKDEPVVIGLAAALLGTVYEFSTKDSPVPRRTLAPLLQQKLGRTKYLDALLQLRRQPAVRDYDLDLEVDEAGDGMISRVFIDLFAMEYSRLRKAVDKDPGVEVLPPSAAEAGVDRDVLDDLRQKIQVLTEANAKAQEEALEAGQKSEQDRMAAAKELQSANSEIDRLRKINQAMQQGHDNELEKLEKKSEKQRQAADAEHKRAIAAARQEADRQAQSTLREREAGAALKAQEYERRLAELGNAHRIESNGHTNVKQQLESLTKKHNELIIRERDLSRQLDEVQRKHATTDANLRTAEARAQAAESKLDISKSALESRGEELESLRSQLNELKEELAGKEEELKTERSGFADLEKELETAKEAATTARKDLDAAQAATSTADKELMGKVEGLKKELAVAKTAAKTAETSLKAANDSKNTAEKERDAAKDRVKSAEKDLKSSKDSLKAVEKERDSAKEQVKSAEKDLKSAKESLKAAEKERDAAKDAAKPNNQGGKGGAKKGTNAGPSAADKERVTKLEAELTTAKENETSAKESLAKVEADVAAAKDGEKTATENLEKLEADLAAAKDGEKAAKDDLAKLETDITAAKESEKAAKEELETLLLVLGDIESKRDEYKAKVKELGGEVTDDDEDDDEDEDEDEEDEDEDGVD